MLRGVSKRVIVIKNPNSELIEEAYFILKSKKSIFRPAKENEMVIEANKIISEYNNQQRQISDKSISTHDLKSDIEDFLNPKKENKSEKSKKEIDKEPHQFLSDFTNTGNIPNISNASNTSNNSNLSNFSGISNLSDLSDHEIFEDAKFFEHMQGTSNSSDTAGICFPLRNINDFSDLNFKPAFRFVSSKKSKSTRVKMPPKSFFVGIGVMSAIVIAIRVIEYILNMF